MEYSHHRYGRTPEVVVRVPGRVNLIGDFIKVVIIIVMTMVIINS